MIFNGIRRESQALTLDQNCTVILHTKSLDPRSSNLNHFIEA